jgi:hypothetical protein
VCLPGVQMESKMPSKRNGNHGDHHSLRGHRTILLM